MSTPEEERQRIIEAASTAGDFVQGEDGFWVYWPTGNNRGSYSEHILRALADELERRNEPIQKELEAFFQKEQEKQLEQLMVYGNPDNGEILLSQFATNPAGEELAVMKPNTLVVFAKVWPAPPGQLNGVLKHYGRVIGWPLHGECGKNVASYTTDRTKAFRPQGNPEPWSNYPL